MKTRIVIAVTWIVAAPFGIGTALGSPQAFGPQLQDPATGHRYQVYKYEAGDDKSWDAANAFAQSLVDPGTGATGHLATITSQAENDLLYQHLLANNPGGEAWLGGFQVDCEDPEVRFDCGWQWVNDEGAFGLQADNSTAGFVNWTAGEPNNHIGRDEDHLGIFKNGVPDWNDESNLDNIRALLVEFDSATNADACFELDDGESEAEGGCNPTGYALLQLDNNSILQDGYRVTHGLVTPDPAFACADNPLLYREIRVDAQTGEVIDRRSLDVFGELGGGPAGILVLDEHTFGNYCFGVLKSETNFTVLATLPNGGVATVTQYADDLLGSIAPLTCDNADLQWRAQATYQADDRSRMIGEAAAAVTNHCNSPSRKSTPEFSFYVLNTREDCGLDFVVDGPAAIEACFNDLAVEVFDEVYNVILDSAPFLVSPNRNNLTRLADQARSQVKTGHYDRAMQRLERLLDTVNGAEWDLSNTDINYPGYLIMYLENLLFRIEQLAEVSGS